MQVYEDMNNVWGRAVSRGNTSDIIYLGDYNTAQDCQAACLKFNKNGTWPIICVAYCAQLYLVTQR